ncbi:Autoinducer 2 sensor kinase/phosphatase LuxQ [compost metagenome]
MFYRATTQSHGTGLGLFIVKDTVERLKGKIEVQSKIGLGTTFKIQIPNQLFNTAELN